MYFAFSYTKSTLRMQISNCCSKLLINDIELTLPWKKLSNISSNRNNFETARKLTEEGQAKIVPCSILATEALRGRFYRYWPRQQPGKELFWGPCLNLIGVLIYGHEGPWHQIGLPGKLGTNIIHGQAVDMCWKL